jgi:acetylornithine deacetylase
MDPLETTALARKIIDIDSTTGREGEVCQWLADWLRTHGYTIVEQRVTAGRVNLLATDGDPLVILSTHLDCVPPFFASSEEDGFLVGRGACDAKGILAAQVAACERLRAGGEHRAGLLFVVGEERGSDGARTAGDLASRVHSQFIVNGEPTDSCLATATRGVWRLRLRARGRAAHSAFPDLGESAIDKLVDALVALRAVELPDDPALGRTHYVVGLVSGGVAPNVVPPEANAEVMFRTVGPATDVRAALQALPGDVEIEDELHVPVERFRVVPDFETRTFPFTTDAPFLHAFGQVLLFGPGSARVAHTDHEHLEIAEFHRAVDAYERLVRTLIESATPHDERLTTQSRSSE